MRKGKFKLYKALCLKYYQIFTHFPVAYMSCTCRNILHHLDSFFSVYKFYFPELLMLLLFVPIS